MSEHRNDDLGVSFTLPDVMTVRQQLEYLGAAGTGKDLPTLERLWNGAVSVVQNWQCATIPDPKAIDLSKESDWKIAKVVSWVGGEVSLRIAELGADPKA